MRILIVDDQSDLAEILASVVCKGVEVVLADGVKSATKRLGEFQFDLVVTDFHMPDGTGDAVRAVARSTQACPVYLHSSDESAFSDLFDKCYTKGERGLLNTLKNFHKEKVAA